MKYKCGMTPKERHELHKSLLNWHKVFLWWPTTVINTYDQRECAWLIFVERRWESTHDLLFKYDPVYRYIDKEN